MTAALAVLFAITGFFLWYGERDHAFRLQNALLVHDWLMYVSSFLLLGHLYLSFINTGTRHSLSGITRGWVREDGRSATIEMGRSGAPKQALIS